MRGSVSEGRTSAHGVLRRLPVAPPRPAGCTHMRAMTAATGACMACGCSSTRPLLDTGSSPARSPGTGSIMGGPGAAVATEASRSRRPGRDELDIRDRGRVARFGPSPTQAPPASLPPIPRRRDRLTGDRIWFASERLPAPARERVPLTQQLLRGTFSPDGRLVAIVTGEPPPRSPPAAVVPTPMLAPPADLPARQVVAPQPSNNAMPGGIADRPRAAGDVAAAAGSREQEVRIWKVSTGKPVTPTFADRAVEEVFRRRTGDIS